jgi:hypothetical protein
LEAYEYKIENELIELDNELEIEMDLISIISEIESNSSLSNLSSLSSLSSYLHLHLHLHHPLQLTPIQKPTPMISIYLSSGL